MFAKLLLDYHRKRMSELGKELEEAARNDVWTVSEHRWTHKESRICFWVSNRFPNFRLHECERLSEASLHNALNVHDRKVLWEQYQRHKRIAERQPAEITLNVLRLKRQNPAEK